MLIVKPARNTATRRKLARIGLAIAGGGPVGAVYEIGALRALDEAVSGLDMNALDVYVGVSSGAFVAAALANGLDMAEMCRIFITGDSREVRFRPETFLRPAVYEYLRRVAGAPRLLLDWLGELARHPFDLRLADSLLRFGSLLPTGFFDNEAVERFLRQVFTSGGRTNDFRELRRRLYLVAVELDSGQAVRFGAPGHDAVPISRAVEASSALPGLYPPVGIDGRYYVDGALRRTMHASVALEAGATLVIGVNPLVPIDTSHAQRRGHDLPSLVEGGLPAVLSQTFRTLLQSRMQVSLPNYERRFASADMLLLEPAPDDADMFFTNVFSYAHRQRLAEHAYRSTMASLRTQRVELADLLGRHGLSLRQDVIDDDSRTLLGGLAPACTATTARLRNTLDRLDRALDAARATPKPRAKPTQPAPRRRNGPTH